MCQGLQKTHARPCIFRNPCWVSSPCWRAPRWPPALGPPPLTARPRDGVQPLDRLLPGIRRDHPGNFYDAEGPTYGPEGDPHYHLKWMTPDGRVIWYDTDARSGRVLRASPGRDSFDRTGRRRRDYARPYGPGGMAPGYSYGPRFAPRYARPSGGGMAAACGGGGRWAALRGHDAHSAGGRRQGSAAAFKKALADAGYVVDTALDGEEGHFLGETEPYDAVVLDLGLPKMDGVAVLEKWRAAGKTMPVLILTARDRWSDKVAGFDAGADDYLAKPFYTEELLARLRALLRRAAGIATADIEIGKLRIDTRASRVTFDGNPVKLTSQEYRLLAYLAHHRGKVVSRTELVEHLYDQDFDRDSNTIEVFIGRLRKKLDAGLIQTVRGLGYSLEDPKLGGTAAEA